MAQNFKDGDLLNNSTSLAPTVRIVKSKEKEDAINSSTQIPSGGIMVVVSYGSMHYVKITDGSLTFSALKPLGEGADAGSVAFADITGSPADNTALNTALTGKVAKAGDTMTGQLIVADTVNQTKAILCKHPTGSFSDAPTTFDISSSYLHLGGVEYATNSYRLLTFGYRRNLDKSHAPAVIGYQETSTSTDDMGRLIFATRNVTTDTAPTVRLHIETNGDIAAQAGSKFVGDGSGLTGILKAAVAGINLVDNTSDASKPVSTAQAAAIALKANTASPTFTGTVVLPVTTSIGPVTSAQIGYLAGVTSAIQTQLNAKLTATTAAFNAKLTATQGAAVPDAAADPVTKLEFDALLASLRTAGIIAT